MVEAGGVEWLLGSRMCAEGWQLELGRWRVEEGRGGGGGGGAIWMRRIGEMNLAGRGLEQL